MKLRYPISTELLTFVHVFNRSIELALRHECDMSVVQYRALSCMRQADELEEAAMERVMAVSASQLSQALGKLRDKGYALSRRDHGPTKLWRLTKQGNRFIESADAVLAETCNQVFKPLGSELSAAIRSGSMLTNQRHGIVRIENGGFFEEHACFEAFLHSERITKESTHAYGFTETEFRIAFALLDRGPTPKSKLAQQLRCAASVVSDACKKLENRCVITVFVAPSDKRSRIVALTDTGRALTEEVAIHVDQRAMDEIRPSSIGERTLYQQMADIIAHQPL